MTTGIDRGDNMSEEIDMIKSGDVVYIPKYGVGIVWRHHQFMENLFDVIFHDECMVYHENGNLCTFKDGVFSPEYNEETSVERFAPKIGRKLTKGMAVYSLLYGVGTVQLAYGPDDEYIHGRAVTYFPSGNINKATSLNGEFLYGYCETNLASDVFPMDNFRPFGRKAHEIEIATCKSAIKDLQERQDRLIGRLKELGVDMND